jgi:hypothetical protein
VLAADGLQRDQQRESSMTRLFLSFAIAAAMLATLAGSINTATAKPGWSSPAECFTDDGHRGYRPCNGGGN